MGPVLVVGIVVAVVVVVVVAVAVYFVLNESNGAEPGSPALSAEDKQRLREKKQAEKARQQKAARDAQEAKQAADLKLAGSQVASGSFGGKNVEVYSNGYVKVALWPTASTPFQKLVSIEYSGDIQKKIGPMRAGVAVMTMGANLVLTPNKRGDIYLNIVTATNTYTLRQAPPTELGIKCARRLAAAGEGVLKQSAVVQQRPAAHRPAAEATSLSGRLEELKKLHESGMLSDEEYKELRAKAVQNL
jgi:hypothetical protein